MLIAVSLGSICGSIFYKKYNSAKKIVKDYKEVYFLQEGVYTSKKSLEDNTKDINPKLVVNKDDKFYGKYKIIKI